MNESRGPEAKTRRNQDSEWTKKNGKSYYDYKLHTITDIYYAMIRRLETTTVEVHIGTENTLEHLGRHDATMKGAIRGIL